jgi:hypothetical protein
LFRARFYSCLGVVANSDNQSAGDAQGQMHRLHVEV